MYEHLSPDTTLVIVVPGSGFAAHVENYPDAVTVKLVNHTLDEATVRDWWKDLDAVVSVETLYDWRLIEWAKADGVRTIIHGNPEFWIASNPQPDVWWWPTPWRLDHLPHGEVVPVPVCVRTDTSAPIDDDYLRLVHVAGNGAMGDRNGTGILLNSMRQVPRGAKLRVYHQTPVAKSHHTSIKMMGSAADRWSMYSGSHALVLPRRYGGLCLPVQEAMASGLVVIMSDCAPNYIWPIVPVSGDTGRTISMQTGPVETYDVYPNHLANAIKSLASNRDKLAGTKARAGEWAEANSWANLAQTYYDALDRSLD
jgi:glycosyltransferase involved in cell wall biosynthesis